MGACAAAAALWGTGFFFGKIALRELPVPAMVLYRFLFAIVPMLPLALWHRPRFRGRDAALLTAGALVGVPVQFLLQFHGLARTTLAHAALMVGTMPVILALGAAVFLHERLDRIGWFALAGSTAGAALISVSHSTSSAGTATMIGDLLIVLSLALSLIFIITSRWLVDRHSAASVSSATLLLGTGMLAAWVLLTSGLPPVRHLSPATWLSLAASGLLCTACTTLLWNWGTTQVPSSEAGVFLNLEPMIGSVLSVLIFQEKLGWTAWLGGALILICAAVLTTQATTSVRQHPAAPPLGVD